MTADEDIQLIDRIPGDEGLLAVIEQIENKWDCGWLQESDKAWDAIHRCLTGGTLEYGESPLHRCILGRNSLHEGPDYIVNFLDGAEVKEVAIAIASADREAMRRWYDAIDPSVYDGDLGDEDFEYTWSDFEELREFFRKAAQANRAVVFTVSQ